MFPGPQDASHVTGSGTGLQFWIMRVSRCDWSLKATCDVRSHMELESEAEEMERRVSAASKSGSPIVALDVLLELMGIWGNKGILRDCDSEGCVALQRGTSGQMPQKDIIRGPTDFLYQKRQQPHR